MRILITTTISNTINAFLVPHIESLIKLGFEVDIACAIDQPLSERAISLANNVYKIPFTRNPLDYGNMKAYKKLKNIVIKNKYEFVHTHTPIASTVVRLVCKSTRTKVIYTAHGFHFHKGSPLVNWLIYYPIEYFLSRYTDTIVVINNEDFDRAKRRFKMRELYLVPGVGVNLQNFQKRTSQEKREIRDKLGFDYNDFIYLIVGELNDNKNQSIALKVMESLENEYNNLRLIIVGDGINKLQYEKFILDKKLGAKVVLLGFRDDVSELMGISDVLLSTSKREGLPINVIEGMATGLPLVVSNCRGNVDLVVDDVNGKIFNLSDNVSLQNCLTYTYNNRDELARMSSNNILTSRTYDIEIIVKRMTQIYLEVISENNDGSIGKYSN